MAEEHARSVKANQCMDDAGDDPFHTALFEAVRAGDPVAATAAALAILDDYPEAEA
ncbi:hypothetical protein ACWCRF_31065 [Streptomyces sp. NPDC002405]|uniref:hypothetical protein n=1 Tax=unclassified Streptomyces TaxID=2593676 RepID=UPI003691F48A